MTGDGGQLARDTDLYQVLDEVGRVLAGRDVALPPDVLLAMYRQMRRLRVMEVRMVALQRQGRIGFYGTCTGQEAPPIATAFATEARDWVFPALRESAIMLARGFPLTQYLAQVFGNSLDVLKGRQMPSHMSGRSVNQVSWSSCIGPQIPQAVGAAWAAKMKREPVVTVGFMGDGATSQPDFHNALNFAAVFRVPCVLVCQNNGWSISVPTARQTASETIAVKARAYGMPGVRVDGNDVVACHEVIAEAVARARRGDGPTFVECVTYRIGAHSTSDDPTRYRSEEEVRAWAQKDPVERLQKYLLSVGILDEALEATIDAELGDEISRAVREVEQAGPPARETLFEDVYASLPWHLQEQLTELRKHPPAPSHS
ncbi:MAG: thiamine pyrophosphate-dependent dehydrogenase E1 component subunit alpha [Polyangiaceae bacterium]|nr:thiamine pyrophosphate-dependent dehydrogenase E1 component subunit alpha [Polyangiaceae bacterium]